MSTQKKFTIIQADGLYPVSLHPWALASILSYHPGYTPSPLHMLNVTVKQDESVERQILNTGLPEGYEVNYLQLQLFPTGVPEPKPWSEVPAKIRNEVDGILVLKMGFRAEDLALFPKLKVYYCFPLSLEF